MIVTAPDTLLPAEKLGRVHFVGIGGAGMSGIARIMASRGIEVSGSDAKDGKVLAALRALGATCWVGHAAEHVADADTVVVSTAIRETNPEVVAARAAGIPILPRAAALASVMVGRRTIAVAGTHGKTTTTSMLTVALQHCAVDPSYAIGGNLNESGSNAHDGTGDLFVAEADESDKSFLTYAPEVSIVTSVEPDHLDNYGTEANYRQAFEDFTARVLPGGFMVICHDDEGARRLTAYARERGVDVRTYGESGDVDLQVTELTAAGATQSFVPIYRGRRLPIVHLQQAGKHNVLNASAALTVGLGLGFSAADLAEGLASFTGTGRRFEFKGLEDGVRVFDSYAHHPTEVTVDLKAARQVAGEGRVIACFQPHLFSRTRIFAAEFSEALALADEVVVMDVFAAREDPEPGITGALLANHVPLKPEQVRFEPSWSAVPQLLADLAVQGDLVVTMGAGDVSLIGPEVVDLLAERAALRESAPVSADPVLK
ncbi:UDP-N-acetylmuramate--L-alanine ligase [Kribbella sp. NPDC056345]|uniref:UDP-N-acetylmuramate--L-alanine ligase n=1 Tax=Kribbella sp. NPDC056345 TaxID=3345789 RepID=UPI0035D70701